jgi:hypothetical protein
MRHHNSVVREVLKHFCRGQISNDLWTRTVLMRGYGV